MQKAASREAVVGGIAGHMAGHHGAIGAAAGCAIGHQEAKKLRNTIRKKRRPNSTDIIATLNADIQIGRSAIMVPVELEQTR